MADSVSLVGFSRTKILLKLKHKVAFVLIVGVDGLLCRSLSLLAFGTLPQFIRRHFVPQLLKNAAARIAIRAHALLTYYSVNFLIENIFDSVVEISTEDFSILSVIHY